jgi:DNA-directed RNA polymerase subunit RPC12/RpoP
MTVETGLTPEIAREIYGLNRRRQPVAPPAPVAGRRGRRCHGCGSAMVHRDLPRHLRERIVLLVMGWRLYRCVDCGHRFFDRPRNPRVRLRRGASPTLARD